MFTPLAHCIRPLTDSFDFDWCGAVIQLVIHPFRRIRLEVEEFSTFEAATDPSSNQIAYAQAWLTGGSAKTTPPSVSHAFRHPLTDGCSEQAA